MRTRMLLGAGALILGVLSPLIGHAEEDGIQKFEESVKVKNKTYTVCVASERDTTCKIFSVS